ncbi:MAG: nuclear transport factor 2 family protein, partial [Sphingobacteriaceae bacterium]
LVDNLYKAMCNADETVLEELVSEKISYGHSSGKVESKQAFITAITSGESDFVSINITNQNIVTQNNTAIVRHVLEASTNDKGKGPGNVKLAILLVCAKQGGSWKLLARQAVKIP